MILSLFLIFYALFSKFIRNSLHPSEPPLAVLVDIILGPNVSDILTPRVWDLDDNILQEVTRIIVGVQCFAAGIELPKLYFHRHWRSVAMMFGPVMTFSWAITAMFAYFIFQTTVPTAMIIGACLSPTNPVLAVRVLAKPRDITPHLGL
jgi:sodium/hydrogen antiporter